MENELLDGFFLGDVRVEPLTGTIVHADKRVHLPSKSTEVLLWLARKPRQLVSRQELLDEVWGDGAGSHNTLRNAVTEIRHALNDDPKNPRFIQTVPTRGYRLLTGPRSVATTPSDNEAARSVRTAVADLPASLWEKLLRHGVLQAVTAYTLAGWGLIQVAGETFLSLGLPDWTIPFTIFTVVGGFPIVVLLSWFLEVSGGRLATDVGQSGGGLWEGLGRNYLAIIAAFVISAAGAGVYQATVGFSVAGREAPVVASDSASELDKLIPIEANSIAVLRFANLDGSEQTDIFANGLSEDILDAVARVPGLLVSARGDSWSLPENATSEQIRSRLRVAYYLDGSVRIEDGEINVLAQLIDSANGFHVQSKPVRRDLSQFSEIQAEVTQLITATLRAALPEDVQRLAPVTSDIASVDAYVAYRRGKDVMNQPQSLDSISVAADHFRDALSIDPDYAAAHAGLCSTYVARLSIANDTASLAPAERACDAALLAAPRLGMVHRARGNLFTRTGRMADAELAYRTALDIDARDVSAMLGLARVLRRRQDFDEATRLIAASTGLQPGNWRAYNALGALQYSLGEFDEAAKSFRRVTFLDGDNFVALGNLATASMMAGEFEAALRYFEETLEIDAIPDTYSNLGVLHYYLGNYEESVAMHRRSIALAPREAGSHVNLGDALYAAGQFIAAEDAFRQGAQLSRAYLAADPDNPETLCFLAWAETMLGNSDEGFRLIDDVLRIAPEDPYSYYYQALIAVRANQQETALAAVENAVELGYSVAMLRAEPYLEPLRASGQYQTLGFNQRR